MISKRRVAHLTLWLIAPLAVNNAAHATTLDEAISAGIAHAPEIVAADADADAAKARLEQAKAGRLPTANLSGTIGYGRLDPRGFFGLGAANVMPRAAQLAVEQPLFTGGRVRAGIDQARAGIAGADAGKSGIRNQLVMAVVQSYGDVLTAAHMANLYGRLVTQTSEIEREARLKFRAGEIPSTDVSRAAARLAEARSGLVRAQGVQVSGEAHFRNLTGLEPVDLQTLPVNPTLPTTLDEAMAAATHNNPALAQSEAILSGAQATARGARAERMPTVGAFAEGATVRDQFFPDYRADSATVGVRARWEFFSGGRASGKVAETDSAVRAANARLRAMRMQIEEQVISAFQDVRTALLVEQAASDQATFAAQARDSVRLEVEVGMKPQLDLLDAERESIAAEAGVARAGTDRIIAAYRLLSLLGSPLNTKG